MPSTRARRPAGTVSRRALWQAFWRPGWSQLLVGLMVLLVAAAAVLLVRGRAADAGYSTMRRGDLITLIDTLDQDSRRLEGQVSELEHTLAQLQGGADKEKVAAEQAQRRAAALSVLAGTAPAYGPGIRILVADPQGRMTSQLLLDAVQELRDSGAEVIEVNDRYRVVASTWFGAPGGVPGVNGEALAFPLVIEAIGDPHSLEEGARFRGGIVSRIQSADVGGEVSITRLDRLDVDSVVTLPAPVHARPR